MNKEFEEDNELITKNIKEIFKDISDDSSINMFLLNFLYFLGVSVLVFLLIFSFITLGVFR